MVVAIGGPGWRLGPVATQERVRRNAESGASTTDTAVTASSAARSVMPVARTRSAWGIAGATASNPWEPRPLKSEPRGDARSFVDSDDSCPGLSAKSGRNEAPRIIVSTYLLF